MWCRRQEREAASSRQAALEEMQLNIQQIFSMIVDKKIEPGFVQNTLDSTKEIASKVWEVEDDYESDNDLPDKILGIGKCQPNYTI